MRILASRLPQVAVCTRDLSLLIKQHYAFTPPAAEAAPSSRSKPTFARPSLSVPYVAPRNDTERDLVAVWQNLLGIDRVGVFDNFFNLGGHSLLGTRLISRLRDAWAVEIPLRRLFETPTVAGVADCIAERQREREEEKLQLLARLEQLDENEVERELNRRQTEPFQPTS
jgi:acyl carrier protein